MYLVLSMPRQFKYKRLLIGVTFLLTFSFFIIFKLTNPALAADTVKVSLQGENIVEGSTSTNSSATPTLVFDQDRTFKKETITITAQGLQLENNFNKENFIIKDCIFDDAQYQMTNNILTITLQSLNCAEPLTMLTLPTLHTTNKPGNYKVTVQTGKFLATTLIYISSGNNFQQS